MFYLRSAGFRDNEAHRWHSSPNTPPCCLAFEKAKALLISAAAHAGTTTTCTYCSTLSSVCQPVLY